jgi:thiol-disulfide isomerase/thioredoxin
MLKSHPLKLLALSLVLLLAACSSVETSRPAPVKEAPVVEAAPAMETQAEGVAPEGEMAEKPAAVMAETAPMAEKPVVKVEEAAPVGEQPEAMVEEKAAAEESAAMTGESMAKVEETAPVGAEAETMAKVEETAPKMKEGVTMAETAPVKEEEAMKQAETMTQAGPTEAQAQLLASLDNQGMPPELFNEVWLNSDPLKLADLHGKVVIVEFWTFGCYNCKNVVPSLRAWHQEYGDDGLVIIGVHTPEFGYEREIENVKQALIDQDIPYAVAIDNDWQTWRAYNNRYWPAKYFIDKAGNLRHIHIGEGRYEQQEEIIQALLAENVS